MHVFAKLISFTVSESEQYCILINCEKLEQVGGGGVKHLLHHSLIYSVEKMYIPKTVISYAINSQKINIILVKTRTVLHINKHSTSTNDHGKFGNI